MRGQGVMFSISVIIRVFLENTVQYRIACFGVFLLDRVPFQRR